MSIMRRSCLLPLLFSASALLAGCDLLGIEGASVVAARKEAEGKAVGGACRHAGRAIEQCYTMNRKAEKAAVFAGWREMNDYMRENKLDVVPVPSAVPETTARKPDDNATAKSDGKAHKDS